MNKHILTRCFWICPLYSFQCRPRNVELENGVRIGPIPEDFRSYLQRQSRDWFWVEPSNCKFVLFVPAANEQRAGGILFPANIDVADSLVRLITAMRLVHKGAVAPGPLVLAERHGSELSVFSLSSLSRWRGLPLGTEVGPILTSVSRSGADVFASPCYSLRGSDVSAIGDLATNLERLAHKKHPENLSIALRRFNSGYLGEPDGQLVDHVTAFESLCLGYDQELKFKLALRVAYLLCGTRKVRRKDAFDKMMRAYRLRNDIVHGNKDLDQKIIEHSVCETQEYLRQTIRAFIRLILSGKTMKDLREGSDTRTAMLDENIIHNGTLL